MSKNLVDYIAICGLDIKKGLDLVSLCDQYTLECPLNLVYKSSILHHYPTTNPCVPFDDQAVGTLCLPCGGINFRTQKQKLQSTTHTFVMTHEDGSRLYGNVLTYYRLVTDEKICVQMRSLNAMYLAELSNRALGLSFDHEDLKNNHHSLEDTIDYKTQKDDIELYRISERNLGEFQSEPSQKSPTTNLISNGKISGEDAQSPNNGPVTLKSLSLEDELAKTPHSANSIPSPTRYYRCCFAVESSLENSSLPPTTTRFTPIIQPSPPKTSDVTGGRPSEHLPHIEIGAWEEKVIRTDQTDSPESNRISPKQSAPHPSQRRSLRPPLQSRGRRKVSRDTQPVLPEGGVPWFDELNLYDHETDQLFASEGVCVLTRLPLTHVYHDILSFLIHLMEKSSRQSVHRSAVPDPRSTLAPIHNLIRSLLIEIPVPLSNTMTRFTFSYGGDDLDMSQFSTACYIPDSEQLPLFDFCVEEALSTNIDIKNFLKIFTCLLLERQILIASMDCGKLGTFCESLKALMYPFTWHHVYVPVLPPSLIHFVQAPVPFLMGLNVPSSSPLTRDGGDGIFQTILRQMPNLCFANLDTGYIQFPDDDTPEIPDMRPFARELRYILKEYGRKLSEKHRSGRRDPGESIATDPCADDFNEAGDCQSIEMRNLSPKFDNHDQISDSEPVPRHQNFYMDRLRTNNALRCCFLYRFVTMFHDYQTFVVSPSATNINDRGDGDDFNRRIQNGVAHSFDACAFLSDQRPNHVPFMASFLDTQAFRSLLTFPIRYSTRDKCTTPTRPDLQIFHSLIQEYKLMYTRATEDSSFHDVYCPCPKTLIELTESTITDRSRPENCHVLHVDLTKGSVITTAEHSSDQVLAQHVERGSRPPSPCTVVTFDFSNLNVSQFAVHPTVPTLDRTDGPASGTDPSSEISKLGSTYKSLTHMGANFLGNVFPPAKQKKAVDGTRTRVDIGSDLLPPPNPAPNMGDGMVPYLRLETDQSPAAVAHTNWKFVDALLKETKVRTKRLLIDKLGTGQDDGKNCPDPENNFAIFEKGLHEMAENVLVAGMCDMLERMWSHGLIKKHGKSALWEHLTLAQTNYPEPVINHNRPDCNESIRGSTEASLLTPFSGICGPERPRNFPNLQISFWEDGNSGSRPEGTNSSSEGRVSTFFNFSTWSIKDTSTPYGTTMHHYQGKRNDGKGGAPLQKTMIMISADSSSSSTPPSPLKSLQKDPDIPAISIFSSLLSKSIWPSTYVRDPLKSNMVARPVLPSLEQDVCTIQGLSSTVHSETGLARAFVRLALERKLLHRHLHSLIKDGRPHASSEFVNEYVRTSYKRYSFLRSEDEAEQFLYHVMSLNAVDYFCFTNSFPNLIVPYKVLFLPTKPLNFYTNLVLPRFVLSGHLGKTEYIKVPSQSLEFDFKHKNLGKLISLRLQPHPQNSVPTPPPFSPNKMVSSSYGGGGGGLKSVANLVSISVAPSHSSNHTSHVVQINKVFIRNEVTGRVYSFRRTHKPLLLKFSKKSDPSEIRNLAQSQALNLPTSNDNLLIADMLPYETDLIKEIRSAYPSKSCQHKNDKTDHLVVEEAIDDGYTAASQDIMESLSNNTAHILKYFVANRTGSQPTPEVCSQLFTLLCGQDGLVSCIERIFHVERRPYSKFFKPQQHVWEFLGRVEHYLSKLSAHHSQGWTEVTRHQVGRFCEIYSRFQRGAAGLTKYDKDTKFRGFVCQAFKDHMLHHWIRLIAQTPIAVSVYQDRSFFRDQESLKHLFLTFEKFDDVDTELLDLSLP